MIFTGKRVALIGPAPHILDQVQDFSKFDFVCRVGFEPPLSDEVKRFTGDRFDVWYPANQILRRFPGHCAYEEVKNIKTATSNISLIPHEHRRKFVPIISNFGKLKNKIQCCPNRGMKAMIDILSESPAELYVTGITFYQDGAYYNGYGSEASNNNHTEKKGDVGNHKQGPQMKYFRKHILPRITMDWKLMEMFDVK